MNPTTPVNGLRRVLGGSPDAPVLTIERWYPTSPADLWQAVTEAGRLSRWLGRIVGPVPRSVGDHYRVDLAERLGGEPSTNVAAGVVLACRPEAHLSVSWRLTDEPESVVEVSLASDGAGTTLVLQHRLVRSAELEGYGGGWEQLLEALVTSVAPDTPDAPCAGRFAAPAVEPAGPEAWRRIADIQHGGDRHLRISRVVPAAIESVWDAFTTPGGLASWWWSALDATHDVDPRPGGRYRFAVPTAGFAVHGTVLELDRPHHLAWSWVWEDGDGEGPAERVDITLATLGDSATRVDVHHQGPWTDPAQSSDYRLGWESTLDALVARHTVDRATG